MIDMAGPGAELTHFARLIHLCFVADNTDPIEDNSEVTKNNLYYRLGAQLLGEYIGRIVLGLEPETYDVYESDGAVSADLPRVGLILQASSAYIKEPGYISRLYGKDMLYLLPTIADANEILDGAMTADTLYFASFKLYTYDYQNLPLITELYKEHGKTLNFVGVIFDGNPPATDDKIRLSNRIGVLAKKLNLQGAIVMGVGNGHNEIDFFNTIVKLKELQVKCVGHTMESPGHGGGQQSKVVMDARADAIVSTGCDHVVLQLPAMKEVIGEIKSIGRDAYPGAWAYDEEYGPSLHEDGSLTIDSLIISGHDGNGGWSNKTVKSY